MFESWIPEGVIRAVESAAGGVLSVQALSGGCVANATRVETGSGPLFLKWADGESGAGFEGEAAGLRALAGAAPADILVPTPLAATASATGAPGFLLTSWIERGPSTDAHSARFGRALAVLHRARPVANDAPRYGFDVDTHCGPTRQANEWMDSWPAFFRERRLAPMAERLRSAGVWRRDWDLPFELLLKGLEDRLPARPHPSLIHGDLWSGNAFPAAAGATALVDPAAYVGDREVDIAMTALFGGFNDAFYAAYAEAWPLAPGYPERATVYDLYHLMNHALIFGGEYLAAVTRALALAGHGALPGASRVRL